MSMITTFNRAVSDAINKENEDYVAIIGTESFVPESTITDSGDFNCGALCNELEYLRAVSEYYLQSFDLDVADGENLESLVTAFIYLPRRNKGEPDATYRKRFRSIVVEQLNKRRTTKWAIIDALSYFISQADEKVQVIELFQVTNTYFELRIEGAISFKDAIFMNNVQQAYLNQNFIGGAGVGEVISYIGEIIDRIKAAGVDYDIVFIKQFDITKTVDMIIGTIQVYKTVDAVIKASITITKTVDATIV